MAVEVLFMNLNLCLIRLPNLSSLVCPVQAHSKLNAEIGKRVILLSEVCILSLDEYFVGELCPQMFLWVFFHIPVLATPCRIPITFVLLPDTCRAAQLDYLVSLSA